MNKGLSALLLLFFTALPSSAQLHFEVTQLGFSHAHSINDSGGYIAGYDLVRGEAMLWDHGTVIPLGTLGGDNSWANEVNDARQVAGYSVLDDLSSLGAFLWENGTMSMLPPLSSESDLSVALGLSNGGLVAGASNQGLYDTVRAVSWSGGNPTNLGQSLREFESTASDMNGSGLIIGWYNNDASYRNPEMMFHASPNPLRGFLQRPIMWDGDNIVELGNLGLDWGFAADINEAGQILGYSLTSSFEVHMFIWEDGIMQDLGVPANSTGGSGSLSGMNEVGEAVGYQGGAFYWDGNIWYDLNDHIDDPDWELLAATEISDLTEIVGYGLYQGQPEAFLLTPGLAVTRPLAGDTWVAGETDTIRWAGHEFFGIDSVTLSYSTDYQNGGGSFSLIVEDYPADSGMYVWQMPDTILSRRCVILIEDAQNYLLNDESGIFSIKPYILTRDSSGFFEPYRMLQDSWAFANGQDPQPPGANMWPRSWWQQFDYENGTDPNTGEVYPAWFTSWPVDADTSDFPDWPLFVRVFGTAQCYLSFNPVIYRPSAAALWNSVKGGYGGSCYGFSVADLLAFDHKVDFINRFQFPPFGDPFQVTLSDDVRRAVNEAWTYQFGAAQTINRGDRITTPAATLDLLKDLLLYQYDNNQHLSFFDGNRSGGHAVVPVMVRTGPGPFSVDTILVYDNNSPGSIMQRFEVDKLTNTWTYNGFTPPWSGNNGLILALPSGSYLQTPQLPRGNSRPVASGSGTSIVEVYNSRSASILITNSLGESVGFNIDDTVLVDNLPEAVHNIPETGFPHPPIGYFLPEGEYSVTMDAFQDTESTFALFTDSLIIRYGRDDAAAGQIDRLSLAVGIGAANPDPVTKNANFEAIVIEDTTSEKVFDLLGLAMVQNDSMHASTVNHDEMRLVNAGSEKSYSLFLRHATMTGEPRFEAFSVSLAASATHQIAPDWADLSVVPIYVDLGNNGTFDDTLYIDNTVDVEDQGYYGIPAEYRLSQNYPNPFNPSTRISYALPDQAYVTLKVYDVLGQEVATLVDGLQDAGYRTVEWDAGGAASGVYLYQIEARSGFGHRHFFDSKKMLLIQ